MTVADEHVAKLGSELDRLDCEVASRALEPDADWGQPASSRDAVALFDLLQPIMGVVIKLGADQAPGESPPKDAEWAAMVALARRDVLVNQANEVNHGLADDSLRLLDRIDEMLGEWGDEWGDQVRGCVEALVDARLRGSQRGQELRRARQVPEPIGATSPGWLARHPNDHFLRRALAGISDQECRALILSVIARLAPSYDRLCALDWTDHEAVADMVGEVAVLDDRGGSWSQPITTQLITSIEAGSASGEQLRVWLVEDTAGPFKGTLVGLLAGERWLPCARVRDDGTLLPLDGTRRLAAA